MNATLRLARSGFLFRFRHSAAKALALGGDVLLDPPKCGLIQVRHSAKELNA